MLAVLPIFGLAVIDSLNPSALAVTLYLLLRPKPARAVLAYVAGIFVAYVAIGIALLLGLMHIASGFDNVLESQAAYWVQLLVGACLFGYAVFGNPFRGRQVSAKLPREPSSQAMVGLFALGIGVTVLEFTTALPYIAAIGLLAQADLALVVKLAVLGVYNLIMILPLLLLLALACFGSRAWQARFEKWRATLAGQAQEALYWLCGFAGFLLVAHAIHHFGWWR